MAEQETTRERTDLRDLVRTRRKKLALSYEKLAERCVDPDSGTKLKSSWLHRVETNLPVDAPSYPQLCALAAGLGVSLRAVQDAAGAQFFGISPVPVTRSGDIQALLHQAEQLSPRDVERLTAIAETFRATSEDPERD